MRRAVVIILGVLALTAPAAAQALPQYPDPPVSIDVDVDVCNGQPVRFTGTAATSGDWTVNFDGVTRTGTGAEFRAEFPVEGVPQASAPAGEAASATEAAFDLAAASLPAIAPGESATLTYTFSNAAGEITQSTQVSIPVCGDIDDNNDGIDGGLSDADADGNNNGLAGILPNTGGPAWWILLIGLILVVGGATVALRTRRS